MKRGWDVRQGLTAYPALFIGDNYYCSHWLLWMLRLYLLPIFSGNMNFNDFFFLHNIIFQFMNIFMTLLKVLFQRVSINRCVSVCQVEGGRGSTREIITRLLWNHYFFWYPILMTLNNNILCSGKIMIIVFV